MSEWVEIILGDVCSKIGSGATPRGGREAYLGGDYALIRSQNIYNDRFVRDGLVFIDDEQAEALRNVTVKAGDVLLNITGDSVARCCQVDESILPARVNQHVSIIRPDVDVLDAAFLRYKLISPQSQAHLLALASAGATRNALTKSMIETLSFEAPPLPEQRAIAHILGTLDDKIELNRRMNETLEEMARALFKAWFVDFEPVRAKMEGRWKPGQSLPGLPAHLYDLFPDRLVDSELGEIPEGWEVRTVGRIISRVASGKRYSKKTVNEKGTTPVLDQGRNGVIGYHDDTPGVLATPDAPVAIFANHTCVMRLNSFPFSAIQNVLPFVGNGVPTIWAFYASLGKQPFVEYKGHWPDFIVREVVVPSQCLAQRFTEVVLSWLRVIWRNETESATLEQLRDTLLPKLISGEVRVGDEVLREYAL